MFNPARLVLARRRRGMTQVALAEAVGVSVRSVAAYEGGQKQPGPDTLGALSRELGFPLEFFDADDPEVLSHEQVSFRALKSMLSRQREAALAAGEIAIELNRWIERRFDLPVPNLPDLRHFEPEQAAIALRTEWKLGERSIKSMVHMLELHGVRVFSLAERNREVDAFSFWSGPTPYVFLNTLKSAEHGRFDAAHELGHLVLHRHGEPGGREGEQEANAFASAFLMPRGSVVANAPLLPILSEILTLRPIWNVSVAALVRRLKDLKVLSEWHYRSLSIEIAKRGLRRSENTGNERETSQVLNKVFTQLKEDGISKHDVAKQLMISPYELDGLVFGLVLTQLQGGQVETRHAESRSRPPLRLIE